MAESVAPPRSRDDLLVKVRVWHPECFAALRTLNLLRRWRDEMDAGMKKGDLSLTIDLLERVVAAERARSRA